MKNNGIFGETMSIKILVKNLNVSVGNSVILKNINLEVNNNSILAIIGPARSGKTTFLRTINRLSDLDFRLERSGSILLDGEDIYTDKISVEILRRKIGMVFAMPIPLPRSIYENIIYGPWLAGINSRSKMDEIVETSLKSAFLWDEVKDRLNTSALKLSGGQQQRLCIARTLALNPEVILLDEPCSGLDPISTAKIEEAMQLLKKDFTFIIVTNNTKQAARVGDNVAFF
ncbi:MAG: phosphate ABC transporter ATP-binding protein, partial [Candidatus Firestonebacteria bacterium]|nr:phosphate ABC transporter ATP-binding protein [Candidatus Firestonebacteria bacterium]